MKIINQNEDVLEHIYTTHDRFLEDLDYYISENFGFEVSIDNTIGLLDCVCGHLLYWEYKSYGDDNQAKLIYEELFKNNEILERLIKIGYSTPELVIYEFNGKSLYYSFKEDDIEYNTDSESLFAKLEGNSKLCFTKEEFEDIGGEITLSEDEEDETYIEFSWSSSNIYFFMKNDDFIIMDDYLKKCIIELNNIYLSLDMKLINI